MARGITHAVFALLWGVVGQTVLGTEFWGSLAFTVLGGLLPDIDHPGSIIGRKVKPIGWLAKHRGFFHSLIGAVVMAIILELVLRMLGAYNSLYPVFLLIGYLSHLVLDGLTKEGIKPFHPAKIVWRGSRKTGSALEWVFLILLVILLVTLLIQQHNEGTQVLLSFDTELVDSPEMVHTVLELLEEHDARATFFVTGEYVIEHPELVRRISEQHEVAAHTMTHPRLTRLSVEEKREELEKSKKMIEAVTEKPVVGFRAPYNAIDVEVFDVVEELGYHYDASTFEHYDWFYPEPAAGSSLVEMPISNYGLLPLEDYPLMTYLFLGKHAFSVMSWKRGPVVSLDLHPRLVARYPEAFSKMLAHFEDRDAKFVSHEQALRSDARSGTSSLHTSAQ